MVNNHTIHYDNSVESTWIILRFLRIRKVSLANTSCILLAGLSSLKKTNAWNIRLYKLRGQAAIFEFPLIKFLSRFVRYCDKERQVSSFHPESAPDKLGRKVILLEYFATYMEKHLLKVIFSYEFKLWRTHQMFE